ncbi:MAG TPA: sorbosone dehydrogenase family protein [Rhodospirillales bacterium]|nr:sorbosone dehydrogenase family protein [Rhodospirillales bacterium]
MFKRLSRVIVAAGVAGGLLLSASTAMAQEFSNILDKINLPPGFKISIFAKVPKARSLVVGKPLNTVFVGSRHGTLYSLRDTNRDGVADEVKLRSEGLNVPNGVAFQDGILYVAEMDKISFSPIPAEFDTALPVPLIPIKTDLPNKFLHGWRYMKFGPDRKLYVAIGTPYNIGMPEGLEGTIIRMDPDGKNVETVARGIRNSVGFDFHPKTGDLFFTDNGADGMGDDVPPDELNHVTEMGQHFGYPYMGGKSARLPADQNENDKVKIGKAPAGIVGPVIEFQAHSANLGMHFYRGSQFPAEYKNDAFVAQHGSWDRTSPVGYRIMRVRFNDKGEAIGKEVFADGWLNGDTANGRPVDIAELGDGSLLVSDDFANVVYRISYGE